MSTHATRALALDFSWQLAELNRPEDYLDAAAELLGRLIPSAGVSRGHLDSDAGVYEHRGWPPDAFVIDAMSDRMVASYADHPMIVSYFPAVDRDRGRPRRTSDIVSLSDLRRTAAYAQILRPLGWLNQLTIMTEHSGPTTGTLWVFDRGGAEFTDEEVDIARMLQPVMTMFEAAPAARRLVGAGPVGLTPREAQVLRCVARGLTARATGSYLRITEGTVHKHLENAYRKLGATNRVVAVDSARRAGII
ncbi:helix-turn-helix transcriptional regulator [Leifsonia shinshuensis]|uniref:Helix-turn-helix transcriptional regulator n=1 Tax=Leifsonia shinshuensis TaxID=150026 RepID=A0A7G6YD42_9MICO|nr:helix-turn-helix domain-containing protein [Leifsonia shinshuensis]QNE36407.1 helix-turn-helix transcriptional regulator [Leifsonia shinshuensis]